MTPLSPELTSALRAEYDAFLARQDEDPLDLRSIARHAKVLPVIRGWGALGAIRLDGVPVEVRYEPPHEVTEMIDRPMALALLATCSFRFPSLAGLRPTRPTGAVDCSLCHGSGRSATSSDGLCFCGGLGWNLWSKGAA